MDHLVCCVAVSPMRMEPSHKSEMVSQQLFGEKSVLLEKAPDNWAKIQLKYDGYQGWVQQSHLAEIDEEMYTKPDRMLTADWINEVDYNGHNMFVPYGCSLSAFKNGMALWRKNRINYKGLLWNPEEIQVTQKLIKQVAFKFLNTSYLWGGKSVFGIDCSGYAQMVYKFLNVPLKRDAAQQATQGSAVNFLQEAHCGDLAFFDNEEGKIVHVGILLNDHEIIHAAGKVRIDKVDTEGILNLETRQRTHRLRIIKRYL